MRYYTTNHEKVLPNKNQCAVCLCVNVCVQYFLVHEVL